MNEKHLGKIESADLRIVRGFLLGPVFTFKFKGSCVGCGGKYTVNVSDSSKWDSEKQKSEYYIKMVDYIRDLMNSANVDDFSSLNGMPVEVMIKNGGFIDFRILTEVL